MRWLVARSWDGLGLGEEDLPIVKLVGADSVLQELEAHADIDVGATSAALCRCATDEPHRNHLPYIKDLVAEMGRSVKVVYGVNF